MRVESWFSKRPLQAWLGSRSLDPEYEETNHVELLKIVIGFDLKRLSQNSSPPLFGAVPIVQKVCVDGRSSVMVVTRDRAAVKKSFDERCIFISPTLSKLYVTTHGATSGTDGVE